MLSTIGVFFMGAGSLVLLWNIAHSFFRGKSSGRQPMGRVDARMGDHLTAAA